MKLLFDQNIAAGMAERLADLYPGSAHVRDFDLQAAGDEVIWRFARDRRFTIVSKDSDFHQRSFLFGGPPKVVWLATGNCSTADIERILREHVSDLQRFEADDQAAFLVLS